MIKKNGEGVQAVSDIETHGTNIVSDEEQFETIQGNGKAEQVQSNSFSANGSTYVPNVSSNGFHPEQQFYTVGNHQFDISQICYEEIITEDDEPVDNFPSEKQQRLLVNPLYSSDYLERPFVAAANVGVHYEPGVPAIVPDMFLSLKARTVDGKDIWDKENRTYYVWKMGKPPEVVLEIVSNQKGNEAGDKFQKYATVGAKYYVVLDHLRQAQDEILTVYELVDGQYQARGDYRLPDVNLSLTFWDADYEDMSWSWLRWCDAGGMLIPTADELREQADERAKESHTLASQAVERAEQAEETAQKAAGHAQQAEKVAEQAAELAEQAVGFVDQANERADQAEERADQAEELAEQQRIRAERAIAKLREAGIEIDF